MRWRFGIVGAVTSMPLPPVELANRVGRLIGEDGSYAAYKTVGAQLRSVIDEVLPGDWDWAGKRILDFGAGAGRTLRHFAAEAQQARFEACDIDAEAIGWLNANSTRRFMGSSMSRRRRSRARPTAMTSCTPSRCSRTSPAPGRRG